MSQGSIVQCIGAVVDIHFPRDAMPKVYDALKLDASESNGMAEDGLTFEVQQQPGDGVVRTIAMGSSQFPHSLQAIAYSHCEVTRPAND